MTNPDHDAKYGLSIREHTSRERTEFQYDFFRNFFWRYPLDLKLIPVYANVNGDSYLISVINFLSFEFISSKERKGEQGGRKKYKRITERYS